jgi:MYXO-CTERM domain-containing protein
VRDSLRLLLVRLLVRLPLRALILTGLAGASVACVAPPDGVGLQAATLDICATAPEGALCDDKNVCTIFDVCKAGICKGSAAPNGTLCTDGNVCTVNDSCRLGTCTGDAIPDTTPCTDGDPCTVGDACKTGACVPGASPMICNDSIACTLDVCVAGVGCLFAPVGDCNVPKDAGPEVADGNTDGDAMMSGGDAPSDKSDGPATVDTLPPVDAPKDTAGTDTGVMETLPPTDAPNDTGGADVGGETTGTDVAPDAPAASDGAADADVDAPADGATDVEGDAGADARDAGADAKVDVVEPDAPADVSTILVLRASGGACACATAQVPGGAGWTLLGLAAAVALSRRRRPRP